MQLFDDDDMELSRMQQFAVLVASAERSFELRTVRRIDDFLTCSTDSVQQYYLLSCYCVTKWESGTDGSNVAEHGLPKDGTCEVGLT